MALQTSGAISLANIQSEFGGSNPIGLNEYYGAASGIPTSGAIDFADFYGKSNLFAFTISANTQEANLSTLATAAGWDGSSTLQATVSSGVYLWSDNTANPGLLVNVASATIINNGKIIGKGGAGANSQGAWGAAGGPAINVTASGVTIQNLSGAYIAGGGGGGGSSYRRNGQWAGGGGGAGGGNGGRVAGTSRSYAGSGGGINQTGGHGGGWVTVYGGGAGGGGARDGESSSGNSYGSGGGGGGRILPGTGGASQASGGSAGNPGQNGGVAGNSNWGGGGGGWGASGGSQSSRLGGAGGAAISGTSRTLSNSGTIYGST